MAARTDDPAPRGPPDALALAARALQAATGDAFFRSLAEHLSRQLGAELVLVGELEGPDRVRTLAFCVDGAIVPNVTYGLADTPCEGVVGRQTCVFGEGIQERFPRDHMLAEVGAHAYVGTSLFSAAGEVIGLVAALYRAPQPDLAAARSLLEIFAARAGGELERQRSDRARRESEERLELALWAGDLATWDQVFAERLIVVDDRWFRLLGYERGELEPTAHAWMSLIHPDDRGALKRAFVAHEAGETAAFEATYRIRTKGREWRWVASRGRIVRDAEGRPRRMAGVLRDVTAHKRLEDDLAQSQRLEAIGRLAGGVAHDFNNLLTAILTSVDFAAEALPEGSGAREDLAAAREAALRAADLTRQLLAFARRQPVQPRVVDVNEIVAEAERLLRRTLGEDVRLVTALAPSTWPVRVDPTQLQQVLLNLGVNARDAMSHGGVLTVDTSNVSVEPGRGDGHGGLAAGAYVRICVTDTGEGMDAETLARVFEPFFTTKEGGRGTGLGLATVYGIVAQAGGHIAVQSEPGVGTTFKIWLPRCDEPAAAARPPVRSPAPRGGSETVLLVEDDPLVLAASARALEARGYEVLRARSGAEAVEIARERGVDLLVSDVVMARMTGPAVAREVTRLRPGTPVLFVSGYTAGAALGVVLRDGGDAFLPKPFTPEALAAKVREVLDRAARAAG